MQASPESLLTPYLLDCGFPGTPGKERELEGHKMLGDRALSQWEEICHWLSSHLLSSFAASSLTLPRVGPHTYLSHRMAQICHRSLEPVRGNGNHAHVCLHLRGLELACPLGFLNKGHGAVLIAPQSLSIPSCADHPHSQSCAVGHGLLA